MSTCALCHEATRQTRPDGLCDTCGAWSDYWNSLTAEQQRTEIRRMDEYVEQAEL
jgi:hypothetical protein